MKGPKSVLNYTTTIPVQTTAGEISQLLAQAKANAIMTEYDDVTLTALSFRIRTEFGVLTFRLPAQVEAVFLILHRSRTIPLKVRTREQAARIAWRIIKDWLEAQLAMIQAGLVKIEQVFLPYAQDPKTGRTVYEALCDNRFSGYLLPMAKLNSVPIREPHPWPVCRFGGPETPAAGAGRHWSTR